VARMKSESRVDSHTVNKFVLQSLQAECPDPHSLHNLDPMLLIVKHFDNAFNCMPNGRYRVVILNLLMNANLFFESLLDHYES
jgi:hypothetical protein